MLIGYCHSDVETNLGIFEMTRPLGRGLDLWRYCLRKYVFGVTQTNNVGTLRYQIFGVTAWSITINSSTHLQDSSSYF